MDCLKDKRIFNGSFIYILIGVIFVLINVIFSIYLNERGFRYVIWSDAEGYYQYLTAFFIKNDITNQPYSLTLENGMLFNKYTCGVAILIAPFFFMAHLASHIIGEPATGNTYIYGFFISLAAIFYAYTGLVFLYKYLRNHFNKPVSFITVSLIFFATNLFYYTAKESGMSHAYSFFLFSVFLYFIPKFYKKQSIKYTLIIGVIFSLLVLIRPTNILVALFFILFDVYSFKDLKNRILFFVTKYDKIILMIIVGIIVFIPQMYYWHKVTGSYFIYSYGDEKFIYWKNPQIFKVLFGFRNGWYMYCPIMMISTVGMIWALVKKKLHAPAILFMFLLILYVNSSWWAYLFDACYGYRSFIEYGVFMAIPLGFIIYKIYNSRSYWLKAGIIIVFLLMVFINIRVSFMYHSYNWWAVDFNGYDFIGVIKKAFR